MMVVVLDAGVFSDVEEAAAPACAHAVVCADSQ